jgi:glutamate/tyrosine decarboxylase-like PLP-dependent enzyme
MFLEVFLQKIDEWTNLIGSYGFMHYVQVDDSKNIAQIAAEHGWKCGI